MKNLKGSEKQIKWAEDIEKGILQSIETIKNIIEENINDGTMTESSEKYFKKYNEFVEKLVIKIESIEEAEKIIDYRSLNEKFNEKIEELKMYCFDNSDRCLELYRFYELCKKLGYIIFNDNNEMIVK